MPFLSDRALFLVAIAALSIVLPSSAQSAVTERPTSSVVAYSLDASLPGTIPDHIKALVRKIATGKSDEVGEFPLRPAIVDDVRSIAGLHANVLISWRTPLSIDPRVDAPRFGANNDYIAYFGEGWSKDGAPPQWQGSGSAGYLWVNHEFMSHWGKWPQKGVAPKGNHLILAKDLAALRVFKFDVTDEDKWDLNGAMTYLRHSKREIGGSFFRIVRDPSSLKWMVDRSFPGIRYDATSRTLLTVTGQKLMSGLDHDDDGAPLAQDVVVGIAGDCSGGQSPWGTIFTAEENVQDYYGDLESCWNSALKFMPGQGFDPGADVSPVVDTHPASEYGRAVDAKDRHARDTHGYLCEIDVGVEPVNFYRSAASGGNGRGHRKLGAMGRGRWENCTFAVDRDWKLLPGEPIAIYAGDDRYSGRVYKFISSGVWTPGMSFAETRALIDDGKVYVAHLEGLDHATGKSNATEAAPGKGRWIEMSTTSKDIAPNAAAIGNPQTTVGDALRDKTWNKIGGFPTDDHVRMALFTACNKVGITETNRPEDVEWNPRDLSGRPRIYIAYTKMVSKTALDNNGLRYEPAEHDALTTYRQDKTGAIMVFEESDPAHPAKSREFAYFPAFTGTSGRTEADAACPDNIMIDKEGGVWFATDGNLEVNAASDAYYYLDLDPKNKAGGEGVVAPTYGHAFRFVTQPTEAEATGPCLSSDQRTFFSSVQHPGDNWAGMWPWRR